MLRRFERQIRRQEVREEREARKRKREANVPPPRETRPRELTVTDEDDVWQPRRRDRRTSRQRSHATPSFRVRTADSRTEHESLASVIAVHRTCVELLRDDGHTVTVDHGIARATPRLVIGDRVLLHTPREGVPRLTGWIERRSTLSRRDPKRPETFREIAANVDQGIITVAAKEPTWNPGAAERFLVLLARCSIRPILCVTKVDLLTSEERAFLERDRERFATLDLPTFLLSAHQPDGHEPLRDALAGATSVFVGHSGVGKSSLINALSEAEPRRTGAVRARDGKGRHTTTSSRLIPLRNGGLVIDTPGIRSIATWDTQPEDLRHLFEDFDEHARHCRFGDCLHRQEPDCGVRGAVEAGKLPGERYAAYLRIASTLEL